MPVQPTYPGVYIEEVPSGVRTIVGVSTSVTAFVGRARRGPVNEPRVINSYADFETTFGGLWEGSRLGYAVRDFYLNGGKQAVIVRLFNPSGTANAALDANGLGLEAAYPGAWGNYLRARIDHNTDPSLTPANEFFNLTVRDDVSGQIEEYRNVSTNPAHKAYVLDVLADRSRLVRATTVPGTRPTAHGAPDLTATPKVLLWGDDPNDATLPNVTNSKVLVADRATDGAALVQASFNGPGLQAAKQGLYALEKADIFNLLCIPPYNGSDDTDTALFVEAAAYCEARRAFLIMDPPAAWDSKEDAISGIGAFGTSNHAAIFFPRLEQPDPLKDGQMGTFAPCGAVAGVFARTDAARGVWKAPAGIEAALVGVPKLSVPLTDGENGELNPLGINCLRAMPAAGRVVWGTRTRAGDDRLASEWKYIPIRRLALYIEESLYRGTQWVVFEPNDEPLWAQIRLNVGAFMHTLFRQGAFQGSSPKEAYFVKCDKDTTPQADIDRGIVNIVVGFAPLKPAEFVIIKIQQIAGQLEA